ncbi:hypothetical protein HS088_TW06G00005 [Tripterygium wilfordii]|uniref:Conserved oligomeric Golgi complex subunit 1 n=1 Tax=Tripterygium wilfordii TaxID=458696 RepID=A0A7J7DHL8_TRIWF|nr:hypothetical protein HS088_TW06G00005 [Tripterygium wilfordii]
MPSLSSSRSHFRNPKCGGDNQRPDPRQEGGTTFARWQPLPRSHRVRRLHCLNEILLRVHHRQLILNSPQHILTVCLSRLRHPRIRVPEPCSREDLRDRGLGVLAYADALAAVSVIDDFEPIQVSVGQVGELFLQVLNDMPPFYKVTLGSPPASQLFGKIPNPVEELRR